MAREHFKAGTLMAPLPAVMVTVGDKENSNIITVAWTGILSSDPPRAYISVRPSRFSHDIIEKSGEFVINLTNERLAYATDYAGIYTGAKVDKFKTLGLIKEESKCVQPPTIAEAPVAMECRVFEVIKSGTHDIFLADIVNVSCDESILDENGKICYEKANLICYSHGEYYTLGKLLGKFGFSTKTNEEQFYESLERKSMRAKRAGGKNTDTPRRKPKTKAKKTKG